MSVRIQLEDSRGRVKEQLTDFQMPDLVRGSADYPILAETASRYLTSFHARHAKSLAWELQQLVRHLGDQQEIAQCAELQRLCAKVIKKQNWQLTFVGQSFTDPAGEQ